MCERDREREKGRGIYTDGQTGRREVIKTERGNQRGRKKGKETKERKKRETDTQTNR